MTLIPTASTFASPVQFHRDQEFSIVSIIELHCNSSISITTQWTIQNCTPTCSNITSIDPTIITTLSELYIPIRTLPYGTYQMTLTVVMKDFPGLTMSSSVYVRIIASNIAANLVQFGTALITSGYQQDLNFDPGKYSIDPNQNVFNASVSENRDFCIHRVSCALLIELEIRILLSNIWLV